MDEEITTTPAAPAEAAAPEVTPAETSQAEVPETPAASEPSKPSQDATQSAPEVDDKLQKFAQSQGIELDSPNAIKAAQALQKARSEATRNYQKASELEKSVNTVVDQYAEQEAATTGQDPELLKTVRNLQVKDMVREFWNTPLANGELPDKAMEQAMIAEFQAKPYLGNDLEALYATAALKNSNTEQVRTQASQETLQRLAQKQQAAVPTGHATTAAGPAQKPFSELSLAEMEAKLGTVRQ